MGNITFTHQSIVNGSTQVSAGTMQTVFDAIRKLVDKTYRGASEDLDADALGGVDSAIINAQKALAYGLVGAWNPASLPEYPDAAAGTTYFFDNFQSGSIDSWAASGGTGVASGASGVLTLTNPTTGTYLTKNIAATTTTVKVRARQTSGTLGYLGINFVGGIGAVQSDKLLTADWQVFSFTVTGTSTSLRIYTWAYATQASTLEIDWIYVGDGTYATTLSDLSGNGNPMTVAGCTPVDGLSGRAFSGDGVNDWASFASYASAAKTFALWLKTTAATADMRVMQIDNAAGSAPVFAVIVNAGKPKLRYRTATPADASIEDSATINDGNWHHVAATHDGVTAKLYVDGALKQSAANTLLAESSALGRMFNNPALVGTYFAGYVGSPRVYNRALSDAEIRELYQNPGIGLGGPVRPADIAAALARQSVTVKELYISDTKTPASAGAAGTVGQIAWDGSYIYVCVAANTWRRAAIATW